MHPPRWRTGVVALAAFAAAAGVGLALRAGDGAGYGADSELAFVSACRAATPDSAGDVCGCAWDRIVTTMPYDRYEALAGMLDAPSPGVPTGASMTVPNGGPAPASLTSLPAELRDAVLHCVATPDPPTTGASTSPGSTARGRR